MVIRCPLLDITYRYLEIEVKIIKRMDTDSIMVELLLNYTYIIHYSSSLCFLVIGLKSGFTVERIPNKGLVLVNYDHSIVPGVPLIHNKTPVVGIN